MDDRERRSIEYQEAQEEQRLLKRGVEVIRYYGDDSFHSQVSELINWLMQSTAQQMPPSSPVMAMRYIDNQEPPRW